MKTLEHRGGGSLLNHTELVDETLRHRSVGIQPGPGVRS